MGKKRNEIRANVTVFLFLKSCITQKRLFTCLFSVKSPKSCKSGKKCGANTFTQTNQTITMPRRPPPPPPPTEEARTATPVSVQQTPSEQTPMPSEESPLAPRALHLAPLRRRGPLNNVVRRRNAPQENNAVDINSMTDPEQIAAMMAKLQQRMAQVTTVPAAPVRDVPTQIHVQPLSERPVTGPWFGPTHDWLQSCRSDDTRHTYSTTIRILDAFLVAMDKDLTTAMVLTEEDVRDLQRYMRTKYTTQTRNQYFVAIKSLCKYLYRRGHTTENLSKNITADKLTEEEEEAREQAEKVPLSQDDLDCIWNATENNGDYNMRYDPDADRLLICLLYRFGLRCHEVAKVKGEHLDIVSHQGLEVLRLGYAERLKERAEKTSSYRHTSRAGMAQRTDTSNSYPGTHQLKGSYSLHRAKRCAHESPNCEQVGPSHMHGSRTSPWELWSQ